MRREEHLWPREAFLNAIQQIHEYELIAAYTGSRPGAIHGTEKDDAGFIPVLCYQHCKLVLLLNPDADGRPIPVLEMMFRHTKSDRGKKLTVRNTPQTDII